MLPGINPKNQGNGFNQYSSIISIHLNNIRIDTIIINYDANLIDITIAQWPRNNKISKIYSIIIFKKILF